MYYFSNNFSLIGPLPTDLTCEHIYIQSSTTILKTYMYHNHFLLVLCLSSTKCSKQNNNNSPNERPELNVDASNLMAGASVLSFALFQKKQKNKKKIRTSLS